MLRCMSPFVAQGRKSRQCNNFGSFVGVQQTCREGQRNARP